MNPNRSTEQLDRTLCMLAVVEMFFFLLHPAKVRSSCEEGPGQSALQSAYHNPQLDLPELKQNRLFRPKVANKQVNKLDRRRRDKNWWVEIGARRGEVERPANSSSCGNVSATCFLLPCPCNHMNFSQNL